MENNIDFKCQGDNLEEIPKLVAEKIGVTFPQAHTNSRDMALLAREMKNFTGNSVCIVPFCTTVEAEALGGRIKLGDEKVGPRIESYAFNHIEALQSVKGMDLSSKRIKEVLDCVETLSREGETAVLNIEGPFTIIASLIDPMIFYRAIRKNKEIVQGFLKVLEDSIIDYAAEGIKRGARIISYGDPVGSMDIVGPKVYEEISGRTTYHILKRLECEVDGRAIIHLCGKTSTAFEKLGLSEAEAVRFEEKMSYGQALCKAANEMKDIKIIGHACIKKSRIVMEKPIVWKINLK